MKIHGFHDGLFNICLSYVIQLYFLLNPVFSDLFQTTSVEKDEFRGWIAFSKKHSNHISTYLFLNFQIFNLEKTHSKQRFHF